MNRLLFLIVSFSIVLLCGLFLFIAFIDNRAPVLFDLNDSCAVYTITKHENNYTVAYRDLKQTITNVMVGRSYIDIERYVGKNVRIEGRFSDYPSNTQCVRGKCHILFADPKQNAVVVDIDRIVEEKSHKEDCRLN